MGGGGRRDGVGDPHAGESEFGVFELEEEAEEDLVPGDGLAGDDERDGELDGVVQLESLERYRFASPDGAESQL